MMSTPAFVVGCVCVGLVGVIAGAFMTMLLWKRPKASYVGQVIMQGLTGGAMRDSSGKMLKAAPHFTMTTKSINRKDGPAVFIFEGNCPVREVLQDGGVGHQWRVEFYLVGTKKIKNNIRGSMATGTPLDTSAFGGPAPSDGSNPYM